MYKYLFIFILLSHSLTHASVTNFEEKSDKIPAHLKPYFEVTIFVMQEKWIEKSDASKPTNYNGCNAIIKQCLECIVNLKKSRPSISYIPQAPEEIDDYRSLNPSILKKFFSTPLLEQFSAYKKLWKSYEAKFIDTANFANHIKLVNDLTYIQYGREALKEKAWNTEEYYTWLQEKIKTYKDPFQFCINYFPGYSSSHPS